MFIEYTLILKTSLRSSIQASQCPSLVLQGSPIAKKSSAFSLLFARFVWWACIALPQWQPNLCLTGNLCLSGNLIHSFVSHRSSHCISRYDASHFSNLRRVLLEKEVQKWDLKLPKSQSAMHVASESNLAPPAHLHPFTILSMHLLKQVWLRLTFLISRNLNEIHPAGDIMATRHFSGPKSRPKFPNSNLGLRSICGSCRCCVSRKLNTYLLPSRLLHQALSPSGRPSYYEDKLGIVSPDLAILASTLRIVKFWQFFNFEVDGKMKQLRHYSNKKTRLRVDIDSKTNSTKSHV